MNGLPYLIVIKKEIIATFEYIQDRDDCMEFLQCRYSDIKFKAQDKDE